MLVPGLTWLSCANNQLTELDLSNVPELAYLGCENNQLTELDLSHVPGLTNLRCDKNQLTELDIRSLETLPLYISDPVVILKKHATQKFRK